MISSPRFATLHPLTAMIVSLLLSATPRLPVTPPQGDCAVDISYPFNYGCDTIWQLQVEYPPGEIYDVGEPYGTGACGFGYTDCDCNLVNAQTQPSTEQMNAYPLVSCGDIPPCTTWQADFTVYGYYWEQTSCSMSDKCPYGFLPPIAIQEIDATPSGQFDIINDPGCQ